MSKTKKVRVKDIQAELARREKEMEELLPQRKEEIFNVLKATGGLAIDNGILAGIALYARSMEGKNSEFLNELKKVGSNYLPRHRESQNSFADAAISKTNLRAKDSIKEEKTNG